MPPPAKYFLSKCSELNRFYVGPRTSFGHLARRFDPSWAPGFLLDNKPHFHANVNKNQFEGRTISRI